MSKLEYTVGLLKYMKKYILVLLLIRFILNFPLGAPSFVVE